MERISKLKENIKKFPQKSGVYFIKNIKGSIIYIGKAKNLKNRVNSYFLKQYATKNIILMKNAFNIDFIITNSEYDALILENLMIKKHQPKYNIKLKDDKTYPLIKITKEDYPRIHMTRKIYKDDGFYFGPYINSSLMNSNLIFVNKFFLLRKCKGTLKKRKYPCLYYYIKSCLAPCIKDNIKEQYNSEVAKAKKLLSGNIKDLEGRILNQINIYSSSLEFEKAMKLRDSLREIQNLKEKQTIIDLNMKKRDYISFYDDKGYLSFVLIKRRDGKVVETKVYSGVSGFSYLEDVQKFLMSYYSDCSDIPDIAYIELFEQDDVTNFNNFLKDTLKIDLQLNLAKESKDKIILSIAKDNAKEEIIKRINQDDKIGTLQDLKEKLNLKALPVVIEGIDITHFGNKFIAGSVVNFYNGKKDKKKYRIFNIKSIKDGKNDDYLSIYEVVKRRYSGILRDKKQLPNLILVDGGKGQLNFALKALKEVETEFNTSILDKLSLISLAKREEEVFTLNSKNQIIKESIKLNEGSLELRLLQSVRDEAHNFANSFNKRKRNKDFSLNLLKSIEGIGEIKSKKILTFFGSLDNILTANKSEVKNVLKVNDKTIANIFESIEYFLK